jgi:hypothetical protein
MSREHGSYASSAHFPSLLSLFLPQAYGQTISCMLWTELEGMIDFHFELIT